MFQKDLFKDKKIFVSGGGSGIGFTIAKQFLELGATVFIASRKQERIDEALSKLTEYGTCYGTTCNIRQMEDVQKAVDFIKEKTNTIDILINNAGGQFPSPAEKISENGWKAVIDTNLNGTWFMTQTFAKAFFIPQKSGNIINIIANIYKGFPGMIHTGAARAGVDNLTKTAAIEWVKHNIRINAIAPGIILSSGLDQYPPNMMKGITDRIPMKRFGTMEEVGWLTLFLSSPMAAFITGETVYVDGGQRLWGDTWII